MTIIDSVTDNRELFIGNLRQTVFWTWIFLFLRNDNNFSFIEEGEEEEEQQQQQQIGKEKRKIQLEPVNTTSLSNTSIGLP